MLPAPVSPSPITVPATAEKGVAATFQNSDLQTFLKMLTTQIKNQDPLNPMEGSDFAVQLATFSGVEQQARTNEILSSIAELNGSDNLFKYGNWIGHQVQTSAPVYFDGSELEIEIPLSPDADAAFLIVLDAESKEKGRIQISPSEKDIRWTGEAEGGKMLDAGTYSFQVESYRQGSLLSVNKGKVFSQVDGVENNSGETSLILRGGALVGPDSVGAIRVKPY